MSAELIASTGALDDFADRLKAVASGGMGDLFEALAEEVRTLVVEQFEAQGNPYGTPWAPRNDRFGDPRSAGGQIMRNTERFKNSFVAEATTDGFSVGSNFVGARVLTEGATITPKNGSFLAVPLATGGKAFLKQVTIPGRQVVPDDEAGPIWGPRLMEVIEDYGAEIVEGR